MKLVKYATIIISILFLSTLTFSQNSPHTVGLSCTPSTSTVTGYFFYRSTTTGTGYTKLNTTSVPTCSFTDNTSFGGTSGKVYFYVATSVNSAGVESAFSNEAKATIPADPPNAPSGLGCSVDGKTSSANCQ